MPTMVFSVVENEDLEKLIAELKDANDPAINYVIGCLCRLKDGKIAAKVFTDEWPNVSAVVCHITAPKVTKVGVTVFCYATSDSALVSVLKASGLVHCGSKMGVAKRHANRLLQEFPDLKVTFEGTPYYLPGLLRDSDRLCPSGFVVEKLTPSQEHAEVVASHWKYYENGPEKIARFKDLIESGHTCAVFKSDETNTPVAWGLQYLHGEIGHVYTFPEYRCKGLATIVVRELCRSVIADGLTPEVLIEVGNPVSGLFLNLGFIESGYKFNFIDISSP